MNKITAIRRLVTQALHLLPFILLLALVIKGNDVWAQSFDDEPSEYELILQVVRKEEILADAILAYERGFDRFYMPVSELANMVAFKAETDIQSGVVSGWFMEPENTYSINARENYYTIRGERVDLQPDDTIIKQYTEDYGEIYLRMSILNQIWPLELDLNFRDLRLTINTFQKLPYELIRERKQRRADLLARLRGGIDTTGFIVKDKPYQMYSRPLLDLNGSLLWDSDESQTEGFMSVRGRNDLLGFSADYSARFQRRNGEIEWPDQIRTTLTRRAFGEDTMPGGIRELQLGDISSRTADWVGGTNSGLGVRVSSRSVKRDRSFDEITIEGISTPGWEVELYRNRELIEFGLVNDRGEYRFDEVPLLTGNNRFEIVLYGPQGQVEKRVEEHRIGGSLLAPGSLEYEAAIGNVNNRLIEFENNDPFRRRQGDDKNGMIYGARVKRGVNKNFSVFATGAQTQTREGAKSYVTAGAEISVGRLSGNVEAYKELGGGNAIDVSAATFFKGWRTNLSTTLLNDFESDDAGFGTNAQTFDARGSLSKRFKTGLGNLRVTATGEYEKNKDDTTFTQYGLSKSISKSNFRLGNSMTANYLNSELSRIRGRANASYRLSREISLRSLLTYDVQPEKQLKDFSTELRYRPSQKLNMGVEAGKNLQSQKNRLRGNVSYDFGTVLAGVDAQWAEENGVNIGLRASTSLAPFGADGGYVMRSRGSNSESVIRSRVFQDNNLNEVYDYEDTLLEDVIVEQDGKEIGATNENGRVEKIQTESGDYKAITVNRDESPNPFLVSTEKGYLVFLRRGIEQDVDIALVESGVVDGRAFFENGNPVPGLRLELIDYTGEPIKETLTSFDGYYSFEFVKPGKYVIRADPSLNIMVPPRTIVISQDALFAYGANVELRDKPKSKIKVDARKARRNKAQILSALQNLRQTLKGATEKQTF